MVIFYLLLQLFIRQSKYIQSDERQLWADINKHLMSEESSDEDLDENTFYVHPLPWRSEGTEMINSINVASISLQRLFATYLCHLHCRTELHLLQHWMKGMHTT